jgi:DNA-binding transcriptional ArsR family regulator
MARNRIEAIIAAMAHPLRARVYFGVADAKEKGIPVNSLAEKLNEPRRRVRYHIDALVEQGLVGIAGQRTRRGVVERSYCALHPPTVEKEDLDLASVEQTQRILLGIFRAIVGDVSAAARGGPLFPQDSVVARIPADLDEQGWLELVEIHERTTHVIEEAVARARRRLEMSGEPPIPAVSGLLLFPVGEPFSRA